MKILLADDSRTTSAPIFALMNMLGHQVRHVMDGRAAVAAYQEQTPDLVLMDGIMPEMDGLEATRQIRALNPDQWVPIIIMTAMDSKQQMLQGLAAGADDYLFKPIDFEILDARIKAFERIATLQQTLAGILENVYDAIITISQTGYIHNFNKAAERIFGYQASEMLGQKVNLLMPKYHAEKHDSYLLNYLNTGEAQIIGKGRKVQGRRKSGELFPMRLSVTEVKRTKDSLFIGLIQDISGEEKARKRIEHLALHDQLTGLPNRTYFQLTLDKAQQEPAERPHMLMFVDLDGFKPINDTLGHEAGDEVLKLVAQRINKQLGKKDFAARLGGDEFTILLYEPVNAEQARLNALGILAAISQPLRLMDQDVRLGASIGALLFKPGEHDTKLLLSQADHAMFAAKKAGKGQVVLAGIN